MRYSTYPNRFPFTSAFPFYPCAIKDAVGEIHTPRGIFCDTESGEVIEHVYENGVPVEHPEGQIACRRLSLPPPLEIVPLRY